MHSLVQTTDPILRTKATPVPESMFGTPELSRILREMEAALEPELDGVALAAPQIGIPYRIFIVRHDRTVPTSEESEGGQTPEIGVFINPEIIRRSQRRLEMDEGCLSVRNIYGKTRRHERATVRARREDGSTFERGGGGLLAQIFQHETDHLDGILFIDHATDLVEIERHLVADESHE